MTERYLLGAYWSSRKATFQDSAKLATDFMIRIGDLDDALSRWFRTGPSLKSSQRRVDIRDLDQIERMFDQGRNRRDTDGQVIEKLGFHVSFWNGENREERQAGLAIMCGKYWESGERAKYGVNSVVMTLPRQLDGLGDFDQMSSLLSVAARVWEPDWAGIMSRRAMKTRGFNARTPFLDWMIYVPTDIPDPEPPSSVVRLPGRGSIAIVQPLPLLERDADAEQRRTDLEALIAKQLTKVL